MIYRIVFGIRILAISEKPRDLDSRKVREKGKPPPPLESRKAALGRLSLFLRPTFSKSPRLWADSP
jgi:hypothetical protein